MYTAFYMQVLSIGLLWVTFHCSGMCGPIVAGLTSTVPDEGTRGERLRARALRVLAYQGGRAVTYAIMGALAGMAGAAMEVSIQGLAQVAGLIVSVAIIFAGIARLRFIRAGLSLTWIERASDLSGKFIGRALRVLRRVGPRKGYRRFAFTGLLMGLLPCMLMFWVLGVAASTASVIHGAGVMVLLVVLTTPVLVFVGCAASLPSRRFDAEKIIPWAMIVSGMWMLMIAMAANGWIGHVHLPFSLFGEKLVVMLW